jgi:hypothetical protein
VFKTVRILAGVQLSTLKVSNVKHFESKKIYTERHELDNWSKSTATAAAPAL